jgi:tetratricopeptide (TPR) repeat protein
MSLFKGLLQMLLGSRKDEKSGLSGRMGGDEKINAAAIGNFGILVSILAGDSNNRLQGQIVEWLSGPTRAGLAVRAFPKQLLLNPHDGVLHKQIFAAVLRGREWLLEEKADLMLWGGVENGVLRLNFLPTLFETEPRLGSFSSADRLEFPIDPVSGLSEAGSDILYGAALAASLPSNDGQFHRQRSLLPALLLPIEKIALNKAFLPPGMPPGPLLGCYAAMCAGMAAGTPGAPGEEWLKKSLAAYKNLLAGLNKETQAFDWGIRQEGVGVGLIAIGERKKDKTSIEAGIAAFREAASALGRENYPQHWASIKLRIGGNYHKLGMLEGSSQHFKQSVESFVQAAEVLTRGTDPVRWADLQNNLGRVLYDMGERANAIPVIEQAVAAFRLSLEARSRELAPAYWASTQNNLGTALFALGKRNNNKPDLEGAAECFRSAIEVYQQLGSGNNVLVASKNLSRVERLLETRASG